jgi:hypothetical protein
MSDQTEQTVDLNRIEGLLVDLNKSLSAQQEAAADADVETNDSVEIIAKGADAIIAQNKTATEALTKGMDTIMEKLDRLDAFVAKFAELEDKIDKGLAEIGAIPDAPKAVVVEAEPAPSDVVAVEAPATINKGQVLDLCLNELQAGAIGDRKVQLMKGISQLDSNFNPADVAAALNLK